MRILAAGMVAFSAMAVMAFWRGEAPNAEEIVQRPRAQLYAELNEAYSRIERTAAGHPTTTGRPPVPVAFTVEREDGRRLSLTASAGWRTIHLTVWLEDGPVPGQTQVKVLFDPESMQARAGPGSVTSAVETVLWRTEAQLRDGRPVTALLGGIPERHFDEPSQPVTSVRIDASSAAPMVDPRPARSRR